MDKQERLRLLIRQAELNDNHCKPCSNYARNNNSLCEQCEVYKELRQIGDALLSPKKVKYEIKPKEVKKEDKTVAKEVTITVERYKELKEKGYTDKAIRDKFGYHNAMFYAWKKKHGLCDEKKTVKKKSDDTFEQIKNEIKKLQSENSSLKEEIQYLRKENDELKADIREHIVDVEQAEEKVAALEEENRSLNIELSRYQAHVNNELNDEIKTLKSENQAIKTRNEELLVEINQLRNNQANVNKIERIKQLNMLLMQELIELGGKS